MSDNPNGLTETMDVSAIADDIEQYVKEAEEHRADRLDPVNKTYTLSNGEVLQLTGKRITSLVLERFSSEGKPLIPVVEVTIGGKHKSVEYHHHDPGYEAKLAEWQEQVNLRTMRYIFTRGIAGDPPEEFVEEHRYWFPNIDRVEMRYIWLCSIIPDDDINDLTDALIGMSMPTAGGISEVAESFRRDRERRTN